MAPEEAHYAALRELGGLQQITEECREMRKVSLLENLVQDIRFGIRMLLKNPGFALVVIFTLALGIGANTAIFSLVNGILIQPLAYSDPDKLVSITIAGAMPEGAVVGFQERLKNMEIAAFSIGSGFNLVGDGNAVRLSGSKVTSNLFSLLGAQAELGRTIHAGDEVPGQSNLVVLSHSVWQTQFGGDPKIVGRSIVLDDTARQIIGVMPQDFGFPASSNQLWVPAEVSNEKLWSSFEFVMIGRMASGVGLQEARAEFKTVVPHVIKTFPWQMGKSYGSSSELGLLKQKTVGASVQQTLIILLGAVALVLLIASVNVANLLLARSVGREKEIAIRAALGASRRRIIAQLLTESLLLAGCAAVAGALLGWVSLMLIKSILPAAIPRLGNVAMDGRVLAFAAVLSVLTGIVFGLAPALHASRADVEQPLKTASHSAGISKGRKRLSSALVITEVALAVILVSGAGLLIKSLWALSQVATGFNSDHLLTARITPADAFCRKNGACVDFYNQLLERVRTLPGVQSAAVADGIPLDLLGTTALSVQDRPSYSAASPYLAWEFTISPDYHSAMQVPLLRGRAFAESDRHGAPGVVIVSRSLAQSFWPDEDPIGKHVKPSWMPEWRTVVGVVEDVRKYKLSPGAWADHTAGDIYFPATQGIVGPSSDMTLVARVQGDLTGVARLLPGAIAEVNAAVPVTKVRGMYDIEYESLAGPRSTMWVFAAFAGLALVLGLVGIYSVLSYSVTQRTREIGLRMALGAAKSDVTKMILAQGSLLALIGLGVGLVGTLVLSRFMASLLHGVRPTDPVTLLVVATLVVLSAIAASYIPSRRATRVDPTIALKYE
jgi:putative ABC transport system permease protein